MSHRIYFGDNLDVLSKLERESVNLIYSKPPRLKNNDIQTYLKYLEPRLSQAFDVLAVDGTLYFQSNYSIVHYCKVRLLDELFGDPNCFLNEIIWAYESNEEASDRWVPKHDTILVYVKDPGNYIFNSHEIDRIPYLAPGLVGKEKSERKKLPTDTWWFTNLEENGQGEIDATGRLPEMIFRRIIAASSNQGDTVLDMFAREGKIGVSCLELGRNFILIDQAPAAIKPMAKRFRNIPSVEWFNFDPESDGG